MAIRVYMKGVSPDKCKEVLTGILDRYLEPAFGSLSKKEADLLMIDALEDLDYIKFDPSVYEMERKLRITRAKARALIYENELRQTDPFDLDRRVRAVLIRLIILKEGDFFWLRVENPLVEDHIRAKVDELGFLSDASFEPGLIKLSLEAVVALIEMYMTEAERKLATDALIAAGAPDTTLKGILISVLKALAFRYAQASGQVLVEHTVAFLSPIFHGAAGTMTANFQELFKFIPAMSHKRNGVQTLEKVHLA